VLATLDSLNIWCYRRRVTPAGSSVSIRQEATMAEINAYWWCQTGHLMSSADAFCDEHPGSPSLINCPRCLAPIVPTDDGALPKGCRSCGDAYPWHQPPPPPPGRRKRIIPA
jgi:hypothetical protein